VTAPLFETRRFVLRRLTTSDVTDRYLRWLQDERANRFILTASATPDLGTLRSYVAERENRADVLFLGIFVKGTGSHIGNIKFEPVDKVAASATMGILIGDDEWRGKGVATEVLEGSARWLFENQGISKIELGVDRDNGAGIKAYVRAGFREDDGSRRVDPHSLRMVRQHTMAHRLALGTAQFGLPYGIANKTGKVSRGDAAAILHRAWSAGLDTIDTAIAYGDSEQCLGEIGIGEWRVISKLPAIPQGTSDIGSWVTESVHGSLRRLRTDKLHAMLLHRPHDLVERQGTQLYDALQELKRTGVMRKIGVSIYDPAELDELADVGPFDLVQATLNVLDRRLLESDWMRRLAQQGVELHVRSVFLQGLLLMKPADRPKKFLRWREIWDAYDRWLASTQTTPVSASLRYALSFPQISRVVVGVESVSQLTDILRSADGSAPLVPEGLHTDDVDLLNPSHWKDLREHSLLHG
jgi:aryl-alcohol dehydrogenase-like predicted oxidoreductase/RimJ/RimL family protein N-acetyltransferase